MRPGLFISRTIRRELLGERRLIAVSLAPIVIGVAAILGLMTLRGEVINELDREERVLAGADASLRIRGKASPEFLQLAKKIRGESVDEVRFPSMVQVPSSGNSSLAQVQGFSGSFPFYGKRKTRPDGKGLSYLNEGNALLEESLARRLGVSVGDSIRLGKSSFTVAALVLRTPGETELRMNLAPRIIVRLESLSDAGLLDYGIRQRTVRHFKFSEPNEALLNALSAEAEEFGATLETPRSRRSQLSDTVEKVYGYLTIFGLSTLIIGSMGAVAGGAHYAAKKQRQVAILRCMGATREELLLSLGGTFFLATALFSLLGAVLSIPLLSLVSPTVEQFLPVTLPSVMLPSTSNFILSVLIGVILPFLFIVPPILRLGRTSPLLALRDEVTQGSERRGLSVWGFVVFLGGAIAASAALGSSPKIFLSFGAGVVGLAVLQVALAWVLRKLTFLSAVKKLPFSLRHGVLSLRRPGNELLFLSVLIGLPVFLGAILWIFRGTLLSEIDSAFASNNENLVLFDVQSDQQALINSAAEATNVEIRGSFPLVSMRLKSINGITTGELGKKVKTDRQRWFLSREYQNTYREKLLANEILIEGELPRAKEGIDWFSSDKPIPVSIEERMNKRIGVSIGDQLRFDVQGLEIDTTVVGIRDFNFRGINPGFFVVFPNGVLEDAPQSRVITARAMSDEAYSAFVEAVSQEAPNVSVINSQEIRATIQRVFSRLEGVVQVLGIVFFAAAAVLLFSVIQVNSGSRLRDLRIYQVLGTTRRGVSRMALTEFFFTGAIGILAAFISATFFSILGGSWAFEIEAQIPLLRFTAFGLALLFAICLVSWFAFSFSARRER